jgi:hypothetical protein
MYEQRTFMPLRYEAFKQRVRRFSALSAVASPSRRC